MISPGTSWGRQCENLQKVGQYQDHHPAQLHCRQGSDCGGGSASGGDGDGGDDNYRPEMQSEN